MTARSSRTWTFRLIAGLGAAFLAGLALHGPIAQDPAYHAFADARRLLGVPNFWNVASNASFVIAGVLGLTALRRPGATGVLSGLRPAYLTFFGAAILVGLGSGYYHLTPDNRTLVLDRLPMTLGFMAFVVIVWGEHVDAGVARRLLLPLCALGVGSVLYWVASESSGYGDLRPYIAVQFLPMLLIPVILLRLPSIFPTTRPLWFVLAWYALAKTFEILDVAVYDAGHLVSGHTLKHVAAACGIASMVPAMRRHAREKKIGD
jgi:hypothetical protein